MAVSQVQSDAQVETRLNELAQVPREKEKVTAQAEFKRAARICQQSRQAVVTMFQEARMGKAVDAANAQKLVAEISDSVSRNASALISLARLKSVDDYTYMHSVAVCAMMIALARQLGLDEAQVKLCGMAGLLHDLGKAVMPMEVLNKPGKLSEQEFAIIKNHPVEGHKMLLAAGNVDPLVLDVCLHHHEKIDSSGYPDQLKDADISLFAKMGAVCDVYDAITSNRPYKSGWDPAESLRKMAEWADGHFDAQVFQAFVRSLGIYPIGSLVQLTSGRIAVVIEQSGKSLTTPWVKVFYSTRAGLRITPEVIDLSASGVTDKIAHREDPQKWNFPDLHELWSDGSAIPI
jgi:putative nucleotidyltransferase with HDIG domain